MQPNPVQPTRRTFLKQTAIAGAVAGFPSILSAANPNSRVQVAAIGLDGMGYTDLHNFVGHPKVKYVGFCDIDKARFDRADIEPGRLRLQFLTEQKVLAEQLREKSLLSLLEEQAAVVFGKKLAIAVEVVENGAGPSAEAAPGPQAPPAKDRGIVEGGLEEQAKQDPLVKRFVETFQGEVEDIAGR